MPEFSHFDEAGKARMVEIGGKPVSSRFAKATCLVRMKPETLDRVRQGEFKKGDVLAVARLAGIMAAKKTSDLIPLCHQIALTSVEVEFSFVHDGEIEVTSMVNTLDRTGAEMEALHAASVSALTIYDMCKSIDREITINKLQLVEKSGGASGEFKRGNQA